MIVAMGAGIYILLGVTRVIDECDAVAPPLTVSEWSAAVLARRIYSIAEAVGELPDTLTPLQAADVTARIEQLARGPVSIGGGITLTLALLRRYARDDTERARIARLAQ